MLLEEAAESAPRGKVYIVLYFFDFFCSLSMGDSDHEIWVLCTLVGGGCHLLWLAGRGSERGICLFLCLLRNFSLSDERLLMTVSNIFAFSTRTEIAYNMVHHRAGR